MNAIAEDTTGLESTLQAGQLLEGKYRVDYLVGQGGMAAVWAGTNERTGKRVALKVLLPSLAAIPGVDALFLREGLAASRVNHPNVVTVFDVIEHESVACIVMELLDGEPLGNYLVRTGPLSVSEACSLILPAMRGVASAHAQGVVHRDVKPQNIFVCMDPDGRAVTSKVLDFGISMIVERAREPAVGPVPSIPMGTPAYMAPEHFSGAAPVDTRADVYGFGVMFFEALTGQVPFPGEPGADLYERIVFAPVPSLAQLRPDVPAGLVDVIETALAKDPTQRHTCVHRMIDAIEAEISRAAVPDGSAEVRAGRVETAAPTEKSGEHQATRFMAGFSLADEARQRREAARTKQEPFAESDKPEQVMTSGPAESPLTHTTRVLRSRRGRLWAASALVLLLLAAGAAWRGLAHNAKERREDAAATGVATMPVPAPPGNVIVSPLPSPASEPSEAEPLPLPSSGAASPVAKLVPTPALAPTPEPNASQPATSRSPDEPGSNHRAPRRPSTKRGRSLEVASPRAGTLSVEDF